MISLLYVDDEPELLDLCKRFLEQEGEFSVYTTTSAETGLEILASVRFDAIISDYQMPKVDGIGFLKTVRATYGDIPFILFTGRGREEVVIEAINNGADFYLQKGGDPRAMFSELGHKIRQAVRRKKAEEELQLLKHSMSNAAEGILWIDKKGRITYFNDTLCSMLGYSRSECSTLSISDTNPGLTPEHFSELWSVLEEKKSLNTRDIHRRKDGTTVPVELLINYIEFSKVPYVFSFVVDISNRIRAEEELRTACEKNKGLMDQANDAIFIADAETGKIVDANRKAQEVLGRSPDELRTLSQSSLYPPENTDRSMQLFRQHAREGTGVSEEVLVDHDGRHIPVMVSATVVEMGGRRCVMSIFHDISDLKNASDALRLANRKLNLLAEITRHDIRNKLTVLGGYLSLFGDHPDEPQFSMYLSKLNDTVSAIGANIEFTRLYQNLGVTAPGWQDVHEVFFRACTHIDIRKVRVESDTGGIEIFADPLLERVFYNIVENALQYGARLTTIRLLTQETAGNVEISIVDDGVGIPDHEKEKIFSKGHGKNTGLGLFLSREILSITGITIHETGEYQHGARFVLRVPGGMFRHPAGHNPDQCYILKKE